MQPQKKFHVRDVSAAQPSGLVILLEMSISFDAQGTVFGLTGEQWRAFPNSSPAVVVCERPTSDLVLREGCRADAGVS